MCIGKTIQIIRVVVHVFRTKENVKRTLIMKKNTLNLIEASQIKMI